MRFDADGADDSKGDSKSEKEIYMSARGWRFQLDNQGLNYLWSVCSMIMK